MFTHFFEKQAAKSVLLEHNNWRTIFKKKLLLNLIIVLNILAVCIIVVISQDHFILSSILFLCIVNGISLIEFTIHRKVVETPNIPDSKINYDASIVQEDIYGQIINKTKTFYTNENINVDHAYNAGLDIHFSDKVHNFRRDRTWIRRAKKPVSTIYAKPINRSLKIDTQFKHINLVLRTNYNRRKAMMPWIETTKRNVDKANITNIMESRKQVASGASVISLLKKTAIVSTQQKIPLPPQKIPLPPPVGGHMYMSASAPSKKNKELKHMRRLLDIRHKRLAILTLQLARMGANTPPHIIIEIEDTKKSIERTESTLRQRGVDVNDIPNDIEDD